MDLFTVKLPEGARVLLLEDSEMRIKWFKKRIEHLTVCRSVNEFKSYFKTKPLVDFIFWDHDLGEGGTGEDAAKFLTEQFGSVNRYGLIHSWNPIGAGRMRDILKGTYHIPFGEFEIEFN